MRRTLPLRSNSRQECLIDQEDTAVSIDNIELGTESRVEWAHLEEWVRQQVQQFIQDVLQEEGAA